MAKSNSLARASWLAASLVTAIMMDGYVQAYAQSGGSSAITIASYRNVPHLDRTQIGGGELDVYSVMDPLIRVDENGDLNPGTAESWEQIDESRMRLTLRRDVMFSDGEKFNAEALKISLDRRIELSVASQLRTLTGTEIVDEYIIDILHEPQEQHELLSELGIFAFAYSPRQIKEDPVSLETAPIGTGPYKVVSYEPGREVRMEARGEYWGANVEGWGAPSIKTLTIRYGVEPGVALAGLQAGELHLVQELTPENAQLVGENMRIIRPSPEVFFLRFGFKDEVTSDPRVREAINLAIDREGLNAPFLGMGEPVTQLWHSQIAGWADRGPASETDLERARELVREADAEGAELQMVYSTAYKPGIGLVSQAVAAMIEDTGLKVRMTDMEGVRFREYLRETGDPAPLTVMSVGYDVPVPTVSLGARIRCGGIMSTYCNEDVDRLLKLTAETPDAEGRKATLQEMMDVIEADNGVIPLISPPLIWGKSAKLQVTPSYGTTMDVKSWTLDP